MSTTATFIRESFAMRGRRPSLPPWPDAELCCSEPALDHPDDGKKCWLMIGSANAILVPILEKIDSCLEIIRAEWFRRKKKKLCYSIRCFMAGEEKASSRPTMFISAESRRVRGNIQKLIEYHDWWQEFCERHPAFGGFIQVESRPRLLAPPGSSQESPASQDVRGPHSSIYDVYAPNGLVLSFGNELVPIRRTDSSKDHVAAIARSTLGGFLLIDGSFYGLTVSHVLSVDTEEDDSDTDNQSVWSDWEDDCSVVDTEDGQNVEQVYPGRALPVDLSVDELQRPNGGYEKIGAICHHSRTLSKSVIDTDWAAISFSQFPVTALLESNGYAKIGEMPQNVTTKVFLVQHGRVLTHGTLSATPSIVCLPGTRNSTLLYSIVTDIRLQTGSCGMWVLDWDGVWYGHVIAGESDTDIVYIMAATEIIGGLRRHFNTENIQILRPTFSDFRIEAIQAHILEEMLSELLANYADGRRYEHIILSVHTLLDEGIDLKIRVEKCQTAVKALSTVRSPYVGMRRSRLRRATRCETLKGPDGNLLTVLQSDFDTLIWIGEHPKLEQTISSRFPGYLDFLSPNSFLAQSQSLRRLESPFFNKMLDAKSLPGSEHLERIRTRIVPEEYHTRVRYVVDLSFSAPGDADFFIPLLSAPKSVLCWHQDAERFSVNPKLVCGRDDTAVSWFTSRTAGQTVGELARMRGWTGGWNSDYDEELVDNEFASFQAKETETSRSKVLIRGDPYDLPLENPYTQLRHHFTNTRLLHALLRSEDPKLDSAAKIWTFCMLADYYGCATHINIAQPIIGWLGGESNSKFMRLNPGIAYRIAMAMQSPSFLRRAFTILMSRQIIFNQPVLALQGSGQSDQHDHEVELLHEVETIMIERAAAVFRRRIIHNLTALPTLWDFHDLQSPGGSAISKLRRLERIAPESCNLIAEMRESIRNFIRRKIYMELSVHLLRGAKNRENILSHPPEASYLESNHKGKNPAFTLSFWSSLQDLDQYEEHEPTLEDRLGWTKTLQLLESIGISPVLHTPYVSRKDVIDTVERLNKLLQSISQEQQLALAEGTLPRRVEPLGPWDLLSAERLYHDISWLWNRVINSFLKPGRPLSPVNWIEENDDPIPLRDEEYKFLPVWAGGLDDGSGTLSVEEVVLI